MDNNESKNERERKIDMLYKNLEHASNAYFAVETVFPVWEAAFALIVGQLFVAYFNPDICPYQQIQLAIIGTIVSSMWFILVSLNYQNALHMDGKIRHLHDLLEKDYLIDLSVHDFIKPWPDSEDKDKWTIRKIFFGLSDKDKGFNLKALKATWFYRRLLPFILCIIWVWLWIGYILPTLVVYIIIYAELCRNLEDKDGRVYAFEDI